MKKATKSRIIYVSTYCLLLILIFKVDIGHAQPSNDHFFDASVQPWYTIITPRSIFKDNKTFVSFQHTSSHDPYVMVFDHTTNTWSDPVKVGDSEIKPNDTHGNPAMWFDGAGNLYVTYGGHSLSSGPQKVSKSSNPLDASSWNDIPAFERDMTYPQVNAKSNGDIVAYYRNGGHSIGSQSSEPWIFQTSSDGGNTWFGQTKVLKQGDGDMYSYSLVDQANTLHITVVHESRPSVGRQDVYYIYQKNGVWHNQYNTALAKPSSGFGLSDLQALNCKVFDTGGNATTTVPDMQVDANNNLYLGIVAGGSAEFVMGKRINENPFSFSVIADGAEDWTDNVVLDVVSASNVTAYLNAHGDAQGGRVEKWNTTNGGSDWVKQQNITTFGDAYSLQMVKNRSAQAKLLFEKRSDHTLYLWGEQGFVTNGVGSPSLTIDDRSLGYEDSGNWTVSTSTGGNQGDYKHDGNTGQTSSKWATFKPQVANQTLNGSYKINVFWKAGANRATNATVRVYRTGGSNTNAYGEYDDFTVDMTQGNASTGQFNQVGGVFTMSTTDYVAIINTEANGFVIADAVQFAKQQGEPEPDGQAFVGVFKLEAKNNGNVLHKANQIFSNDASGNYAITFTSNSFSGQRWTFEEAGPGYHYIKSESNGRYLQESSQTYSSNSNGQYVITFPKSASDGQRWSVQSVGNGYYKIINKQSGKALHNASEVYSLNATGRYVITFTDQGSDRQKWKLDQLGGNNARNAVAVSRRTEIGLLPNPTTKVIMYPNPAHSRLQFLNLNNAKARVKLEGLQGRTVLENVSLDQQGIDVSKLPTGVYTVQILVGNQWSVHKLEKK
ncbi:MAG: BNR-4 repeat-containing protein [Tunicatimonas sp.]